VTDLEVLGASSPPLRLVPGARCTEGAPRPSLLHPSQGLRRRPVLYAGSDAARRVEVVGAARRWPMVKLLVARSGAQAVRIAEDRRLRLIVTDARLEDLDAGQLAEAVRRRAGCATVPIVVLGSDGSASERARFLWAGADAVLAWSAGAGDLDHTVGLLLEDAGARW